MHGKARVEDTDTKFNQKKGHVFFRGGVLPGRRTHRSQSPERKARKKLGVTVGWRKGRQVFSLIGQWTVGRTTASREKGSRNERPFWGKGKRKQDQNMKTDGRETRCFKKKVSQCLKTKTNSSKLENYRGTRSHSEGFPRIASWS